MQYISILRGINVGGKRKLLMADLKELYLKLGLINPITYIQSGNVLFESETTFSENELAQQISNAIAKQFSYDVPVIVRSKENYERVINNNPYTQRENYDMERLHITFLSEEADKAFVSQTLEYSFEPDSFSIHGDCIYVFCAGKYHESKLGNTWFEKKLKVSATTRNWKTSKKLLALASK